MDAVTITVSKDDLDLLIWAVEAYVAKAEGAKYNPYPQAPRVLRDLKRAEGAVDQTVSARRPEEQVAQGLNRAGYILEDRHGVEVERGTLDECIAYLHRNHPFAWEFAGSLGYTLKAI